jgi:L,D-peptidoglycan transpeptidase YkuD (ErfK/YbiS/YcfS/YnhG family)
MRSLVVLLFGFPFYCHAEDRLSPSVKQLLVAIAPDWNNMHGKLQRLEKTANEWHAVGPPISVLFGKSGLAWGRGLLAGQGGGSMKVERDHRAPAGVFRIGVIYTYDKSLPPGSDYPFHTVGPGDAWVDDIHSVHYNQLVTVDPHNPPAWFGKQKMRHGDFAYRWLIEIRHNTDPPTPGFGSAIFFHIRRGPARPSAGCTTMAEQNLVEIIRWLRSSANPEYVCLPKAEYLAHAHAWGLPDPEVTQLF